MNGERDPRDAGGKDDADRCTVGDDYTPAALAAEADSPAPAIRRDPAEGHLEPVAGDVGVWAAGITGDGRDHAEDVPSRRDCHESRVVDETSLALHHYCDRLPYGRGLIAGGDRNLELGKRGGAQNERHNSAGGKSLHAASTPQLVRSFHATRVTAEARPRDRLKLSRQTRLGCATVLSLEPRSEVIPTV
jgi:hypothetical protein